MDKRKLNIGVDCNFNYHGFDKPIISPFEVEYFELKDGDVVTASQDDTDWEATVRFDPSCPEEMRWYLELNLDKESPVSDERVEGRSEGSRSAVPLGEIRGEQAVVTKMLEDGMEIETILKYTRLSKTRIINLKNQI